jgi:hypothetical protein
VVLFTVVLAAGFPGFAIPIDTTDARQLFLDLILFTGYLYAARTLFRLPFALGNGVHHGIGGIAEISRYYGDATLIKRFRSFMRGFVDGLLGRYFWQGSLGVLDRLGVIGLAFAATLPQLRPYVLILGISGLVFLLLLYVLRGTFCFVLEDAFKTAEDDYERLVEAAGRQPRFPSVIETKPYSSWDGPDAGF